MIIAVKTREFKRVLDYDWEDYFPSDKPLSVEAGKHHRALEGADVDSRFIELFRPSTGIGVTLGVSVTTNRSDAVGRPIRTIAFLQAETPDETELLTRFFAECLRKSDAETLYDPESGIAKAVESLYKRKKSDEFLAFCRTLPPVGGNGSAQKKGIAFIPRKGLEGMRERQSLANALPTAIEGNSPFLFVLTDRLPTDVLDPLGSMFDHATIRIFSKAVDHREDIPEPVPQKYRWAAAIGAAVILVLLVVAMANLPRGCRKQPEVPTTTGEKGGGTNDSKIVGRPITVDTIAQPQVVTETTAPSNSQAESDGPAASATTNATAQKATVTNSLKSASARAEKEKTGK